MLLTYELPVGIQSKGSESLSLSPEIDEDVGAIYFKPQPLAMGVDMPGPAQLSLP